MTTVETVGATGRAASPRGRGASSILAQTAIDFWGKRRVWLLDLGRPPRHHRRCRSGTRGLVLGIDFEGGVAWDVPAGQLSVDDARQILVRQRPRERHGQDPGAQLRQRRHHQGAGRGPARGGPRPAAGGVRHRRRRRRRRGQRGVGQRVVGRGDHAEGGHRPGRVPRPDRRLHLVPLRVADGADGDPGDGPRRRRQRRHLLGVRLRGHAGDGRRLPDRPRLLAVRQHRRVRPHPGQRAARRRGRADRRRPRSTSRRTRCCCARSTRRWRRPCR